MGGFRIFKVNPGSPAAEAGLEVFFDFIVEIDGVHMDADQATFASAIQEAENQRTKLVVHNIRTHTSGPWQVLDTGNAMDGHICRARDVYVTPRQGAESCVHWSLISAPSGENLSLLRRWGGAGLLGAVVLSQVCSQSSERKSK